MATAHRQKRVLATCAATCAAAALTLPLSGCLDAVMGSSDRGADAPSELETSVDSAYLVPTYIASCEIQAGDSGVLRFTATNTRITETERLLSVTTPAAADIRFEPPLPVDIPPELPGRLRAEVAGGGGESGTCVWLLGDEALAYGAYETGRGLGEGIGKQ